jgi:hypothetical protein
MCFQKVPDANTTASSEEALSDPENLRSELGAFMYPEVPYPVAQEVEEQEASEVVDDPIYAALV